MHRLTPLSWINCCVKKKNRVAKREGSGVSSGKNPKREVGVSLAAIIRNRT